MSAFRQGCKKRSVMRLRSGTSSRVLEMEGELCFCFGAILLLLTPSSLSLDNSSCPHPKDSLSNA